MKNIVFILLFFIFLTQRIYSQNNETEILKGTCIVSLIWGDTVYIGADSKLLSSHGTEWPPECKILKFDDFVFTHTGIYKAPSKNIDVNQKYIEIASKKLEYLETRNEFNNYTANLLKIYMEDILSSEQKLNINKMIKPDIVNIYINIEEYPNLSIFKYKIKSVNIVNNTYEIICDTVNIKTEITRTKKEKYIINIYGINRESNLYLKNNKNTLDNYTPIELIEKLINIEIENDSLRVGEPIDIIKITKEGAEWIQCKEKCK